MIRIVVVDDNQQELEHIKLLLYQVLRDEFEFIFYSQINEDLLKEIKFVDSKKIYILNVENGERTSGITLSKMIRENDFDSEIILITRHDQMFEIAHRSVYKIFDFIEKFHEFDKRFKKDIRKIVNMCFDNKMFIYKDLSIYYKSIVYIYRETEERKLVIVTDNKKYLINLSIKEIKSSLDRRFVQCHRSCIMNIFKVEEKNYKEGYFVTNAGEKVYFLSKKFKNNIDKTVNEFFN